jgi:hypothetical protein
MIGSTPRFLGVSIDVASFEPAEYSATGLRAVARVVGKTAPLLGITGRGARGGPADHPGAHCSSSPTRITN